MGGITGSSSVTAGTGLSGNGTPASPLSNTGALSVDGVAGGVTLSALAAFAASLGANGYQKLPSGLIIQWGSTAVGIGSTITFPISFTTTNYVVSLSFASYSSTATMGPDIINITNTSASQAKLGNFSGFDGITTRWLAIGY